MSFVTSETLSLEVADEMANLAIKVARRNKFKDVAVCVMDSAGFPIVTKRMDHCPALAYPKISQAKATTCIATKMSSGAYGKKYLWKDATPDVFCRVLNQAHILDGGIAAFPGGAVIKSKRSDGIVGSIGVSGAAGAEDEYIALRAVQECSVADQLMTDPEDHACTTRLDID